jgi:Alpha/beta hydrolase domain
MTLGPEHWCPLVGDVEIQGPVAGGRHGWPFGASVEDLAVLGYVEEEYFVAGMAPTYALAPDSAYTRDGRWSAEWSQVVPFRTRIVVRASSRVEQRVHGARAAIRAGTELQALAGHTETAAAHREGLLERMKARNQD